jgi:hypothetical protein
LLRAGLAWTCFYAVFLRNATLTRLMPPIEGFLALDPHNLDDRVCWHLHAEAIVFTLARQADIPNIAERFNYIDQRFARVVFYGEDRRAPAKASSFGSVTTVRVAAPNEYPPRLLELRAMEYLSECMDNRTSFALRLDFDAFVSPVYLDKLYTAFSQSSGYQTKVVGKSAFGVSRERGKLGLPTGIPFCMGGLSVAYGRQVIASMKGKWDRCAHEPVSAHSDTETQRCIYEATHTYCEGRLSVPDRLINLYRRDIHLRLSDEFSSQQVDPDSFLAAADVVHPLKNDASFQKVRRAALLHLAPPITAQHMLKYTYASSGGVCVVNMFAQRQVSSCSGAWNGDSCSFDMQRCAPGTALRHTMHFPAYILSMDSTEREELFVRTAGLLRRAGFKKIVRVLTLDARVDAEVKLVADWARKRFHMPNDTDDRALLATARASQALTLSSADPDYVPTIGEISVRAAHKATLSKAVERGAPMFMIGEDDIVPIRSMQYRLKTMLQDGCGKYLSKYAGLLLLGSSEWNQRWEHIDKNRFGGCYDVHDRTFGAFAVLYNRNGAIMVLEQLASRPNMPFDHAFYLAALQGTFVAAALPNLMIIDHRSKVSTVNAGRAMNGRDEMELRAERNRWELSDYLFSPRHKGKGESALVR